MAEDVSSSQKSTGLPFHEISDHMEAGGVAAAVLSESGKIYTGVCVDTACTLGVCAERNALFNMITNGETKISRVLALMSDGKMVRHVVPAANSWFR